MKTRLILSLVIIPVVAIGLAYAVYSIQSESDPVVVCVLRMQSCFQTVKKNVAQNGDTLALGVKDTGITYDRGEYRLYDLKKIEASLSKYCNEKIGGFLLPEGDHLYTCTTSKGVLYYDLLTQADWSAQK